MTGRLTYSSAVLSVTTRKATTGAGAGVEITRETCLACGLEVVLFVHISARSAGGAGGARVGITELAQVAARTARFTRKREGRCNCQGQEEAGAQ